MKNFRSYLALLMMGFLLAACSSEGEKNEPDNPSNPNNPTQTAGTMENVIVGTWINEYRDSWSSVYYYERYEWIFNADHTGVLKQDKDGSSYETEKFTWSLNEKSKILTTIFDGERETSQILAFSPKYAVISAGDEEELWVKKGDVSASCNVVDSSYKMLGKWVGYQDEDDGMRMELDVNIDGSALMNIYDMRGRLLSSDEIVWAPGSSANLVMTYFVDPYDYDVDDEPYTILLSTGDELMLNRIGSDDVYSFVRSGSDKSVTSEMLVGKWRLGYNWDEYSNGWDWDTVELKKDGKGMYSEHANSSRPDNVDLTWTFDAMSQTVTIKMKNGEYGYKPGEPEYETMSVRILLANDNMIFGLEDGEDIITLFRM